MFYPHIDVLLAHEIALNEFKRYSITIKNAHDIHRHMQEVKLFDLALSAADDNLLMQFDSRVYHELQVLDPNRSATISFYGRYIDDNLGLVYTLNKAQALE